MICNQAPGMLVWYHLDCFGLPGWFLESGWDRTQGSMFFGHLVPQYSVDFPEVSCGNPLTTPLVDHGTVQPDIGPAGFCSFTLTYSPPSAREALYGALYHANLTFFRCTPLPPAVTYVDPFTVSVDWDSTLDGISAMACCGGIAFNLWYTLDSIGLPTWALESLGSPGSGSIILYQPLVSGGGYSMSFQTGCGVPMTAPLVFSSPLRSDIGPAGFCTFSLMLSPPSLSEVAAGALYHAKLILNRPVEIASVSVPASPLPLTTAATATVSVSGGTDTGGISVNIDWGDGVVTSASSDAQGIVSGAHLYALPGVYFVTASVNSVSGCPGAPVTAPNYVVIYNPNGGFVTGGGSIISPPGAYTLNPTLTGVASFGFVARYQPGATIPTGNTEFQFQTSGLNFHSTSYEWLVVAGAKAQYKGQGQINGAGSYDFMLSAIDGALLGNKSTDKFRIKISDGSGVIYDNLLGSSDQADPTTTLTSGSIVIHK
jgi:hypothetical protein